MREAAHLSAHTLPPVRGCTACAAEPLDIVIAVSAVVVPTTLTYNLPPSATFLNQAAAIVGWGVLVGRLASTARSSMITPRGGLMVLLAAVFLLLIAALASELFSTLPHGLALSAVATLVMALLLILTGAATEKAGFGEGALSAICWAILTAGLLSSAVGIVQVFAPYFADGQWIAVSATPGRASGNVRQPNHLSSLLLWSVIATVWLAESGRLRRAVGAGVVLALIFTVVLTASRTGVVGVGMLALWGALDRRLSRAARVALVAAPMAYFLFWSGLAAWAHDAFGGETRLSDIADSPNSRRHIWANTLSLISRYPWSGVGFGEFNFAWSLTPFPNRPTAFFDHTHNLPLQLAVELGVPLAALVLALLGYALWRAMRHAFGAPDAKRPMTSAAAMLVLMIAVHSLVEYPLWYSYFLLPTAFAWGLCLGARAKQAAVPATGRSSHNARGSRALLLAAVLMTLGGMLSIADYLRVSPIFTAEDDALALSERIEAGKRSVLFAHHAHYAAATTAERPSEALPSFNIAAHYLLDTRLMMAWAIALHQSGDEDRARYVAARLREFRNPDSVSFFAPCEAPHQPGDEKPFQCLPPTKSLSFEDFR